MYRFGSFHFSGSRLGGTRRIGLFGCCRHTPSGLYDHGFFPFSGTGVSPVVIGGATFHSRLGMAILLLGAKGAAQPAG